MTHVTQANDNFSSAKLKYQSDKLTQKIIDKHRQRVQHVSNSDKEYSQFVQVSILNFQTWLAKNQNAKYFSDWVLLNQTVQEEHPKHCSLL